MGERAPSNEAIELWSDRKWRLNNLYWIEDKHGKVIPFKLNASQDELLGGLHDLNIILKARQMGFSTFILILALDCCLFNDHFAAGLVADTLDNAKNLLKRIKFAYDRLEKEIRDTINIKADNAQNIEFSNGSSIEVGVSLRSGTKNLLHISEYGKICAKDPGKANEIKSGSLNTLAKGQLGFIESTAEGRAGDFYDKCEQSRAIVDEGREPRTMEYKFHFFAWWQAAEYTTDEIFSLSDTEKAYFRELLDDHGIELTDGQKSWYAGKKREQGDDMLKEYPSIPDEAFAAAKDGAYFAKDIRSLRLRGKIGEDIQFTPKAPVDTYWDLGVSDSTTIWLRQTVNGRHRFVGYYENSGEGMAHYLDWLDKWRSRHGAVFGSHYGPHDIGKRMQGRVAETIKDIAFELGYSFIEVPRTADKLNSIQAVRTKLPECEFATPACAQGIIHLENYCREWDDKYGVWKSRPRHDKHSHGADGFMTFADGHSDPVARTPRKPRIGTIA